MELVDERNGFKICEREDAELGYFSSKRYVVFHRDYEGVWIADFKSLQEAEKFCEEEDADYWGNEISKY